MTARYIEKYVVFTAEKGYYPSPDPRGLVAHLIMGYTDENWERREVAVPDLPYVLQFARGRSPDWVVEIVDDMGNVIRRFTPKSYLKVNPQDNPFYLNVKPEGQEQQRIGPMSEADLWVEDIEGDLHPIYTSADPTFEEIGQQLRERRVELGLQQKQVASMADMSPQYYSDIENAKARASRAVLRLIAKVLHSRFDGPLPASPRRRQNPGASTEVDAEHYEFFHGVPPDKVVDYDGTWIPGRMVLIGVGKDVGYGILNKHSTKDGWYVHDFGRQVKVYRRARRGERADKTWSRFPTELTSLGYNIGFTYVDDDGGMKEVKGSRKKYLAVTPSRRTLVVVGPKGVEYLMEGGEMRVDDWIRD